MPVLATIGYEKAAIDDLIATLKHAGVTAVVDVRERPISRRPGFSKGALSRALEAAGIGYASQTALGTPRPGQEAARAGRMDEFHAIFARHLATPEAQAGLETVITRIAAGRETLCLLCYERESQRCHRSQVAAAIAGRMAVAVVHLTVDEGAAGDDPAYPATASA